MPLRHIVLAALIVIAAAACSSGSASGPPASSGVAGSPASTAEVNVGLTDALVMEPAGISVKAGVPVRFVVTNTGATEHEFFLGDEAAQMTHGEDMAGMPGMTDDAAGIALAPGETKTLEFTFSKPGMYQAGCHVAGHYEAGMKAMITVTE